MPTEFQSAVLLLPRIRVQAANAQSSPLTWGFPAISAFLGLMSALERKLGTGSGLHFANVGVVCHRFDAQVHDAGHGTRRWRLTRNPVQADGSTAAIVEEGRVHLEISLVFELDLASEHSSPEARQVLAGRVWEALQTLRVAGGSVLPPLPGRRGLRRPVLELVAPGADAEPQFRKLMQRCLPGFALVLRDDLLAEQLAKLHETDASATALDAWLRCCALTTRAVPESQQGKPQPWQVNTRPGWLVPIPVGFGALGPLQPAGTVRGARDASTPFRFVESLWSIGQWISPHRLRSLNQLTWYADPGDAQDGQRYRCRNDYVPTETN